MSTTIHKYIFKALLYINMMCCTALVSCFSDDYSNCPIVDNSRQDTYLTLTISTTSNVAGTRTNPNGGQDGDGREYGINNENNIYNLNLILYDVDDTDGINNNSNPELNIHYLNEVNFSGLAANNYTYRTAVIEIENFLITSKTHLIVVANLGDLTSKSISTLSELRNYILYDAVYTSGATMADYNYFAMASAVQSNITLVKDGKPLGTEANPVLISTTIERLASRIDIVPNATINGTYYEYAINNNSADKIRVTHITPFNVWSPSGGEYLLKRVSTTGSTSDQIILGNETPVSGVQTNYVLSPYMLNSDGMQKSASYWNSNASTVKEWYHNHITSTLTTKTVKPITNTDASNNQYYILDYVQENTLLKENQMNCFSTGVVLQATYIPEKVYLADGTTLATYAVGSTFWMLNGKFYNQSVAGATQYTNGICYYRYYIRHSNDNVLGQMDKMEYGIVRNNIYRLAINSFQQIGDASPQPSVPTIMDEYLKINL